MIYYHTMAKDKIAITIEQHLLRKLDELVVTDSIPLSEEAQASPNIRVLTLSKMLAEAMRRISNEESLSAMFAE